MVGGGTDGVKVKFLNERGGKNKRGSISALWDLHKPGKVFLWTKRKKQQRFASRIAVDDGKGE